MEHFIYFESFIAIDVLKIFYTVGVLLLPVVSWFFLLWVIDKYSALFRLYKGMKHSFVLSFIIWVMSKIKFFQNYVDKKVTWGNLSFLQRLKFLFLFFILVFFLELFYRLVMEYLIAFMQMHDALVSAH